MSQSPSSVWNNCLNFIEDNIQPQAYKTWFEPIIPVKLSKDVLSIQVPSKFFYEWLEKLKMPYEKIEENDIILPVVRCEIKFIKSLFFGDSLYVNVICEKEPTSTIEFKYQIFNQNNELTTEGATTLAFLNSKSMKPKRCPKIISELFDF